MECLLELEYLLKDGLINSLLLELVQVTTGFILSASFLADLRSLFRRYNANIVVDEVMTAGRTSEFLLYSTKCGFQADYISMGKWVMGGLVLRRDTTVGPWDGPVASMARQGALQYGQIGSSLGEISVSIASMAANLRSIMRMIEARGSKQLGKVVSMCRDRFIHHLVQQFPSKQLHFWGVGGMVYCNVAANRPTQLRSRFLLLITGREVRFDLTRVQGTSTRMGVLACSPYVDDTLQQNAITTMREGLSWCGRLMTPALRLLHGSREQIAAALKAQQPVVAGPGWVAGPYGGLFPPSRLSQVVVPPPPPAPPPPEAAAASKAAASRLPKALVPPLSFRGRKKIAKVRKSTGRKRMAEIEAESAAAALVAAGAAAAGEGSSSDPPPLVGAVQEVVYFPHPGESDVETESEAESDDAAAAACMARQYAAAAAARQEEADAAEGAAAAAAAAAAARQEEAEAAAGAAAAAAGAAAAAAAAAAGAPIRMLDAIRMFDPSFGPRLRTHSHIGGPPGNDDPRFLVFRLEEEAAAAAAAAAAAPAAAAAVEGMLRSAAAAAAVEGSTATPAQVDADIASVQAAIRMFDQAFGPRSGHDDERFMEEAAAAAAPAAAPAAAAPPAAAAAQAEAATAIAGPPSGYPTGPCTTLYDLVRPRHWLGMGPYHLIYSPQEHKSTGNDGS